MIRLNVLTPERSKIVGEVLHAAADGPFFDDVEFGTLFIATRQQVRDVADSWPHPTQPPDIVAWAINHSFLQLLCYPHHMEQEWPKWISVDAEAVEELYDQLRGRLDTDERPGDCA